MRMKKIIFFLVFCIFLVTIIIEVNVLRPNISNTNINAFASKKEGANVNTTVDPTKWVAVDGLGRTLSTNEKTGNVKTDKEVGIFFWNWHDTETIMYIRDKENDFNKFLPKKPYNIQNALDKYPNNDATNFYDPMWEGQKGYLWWNQPIYGYYRNDDDWVLRRQAELLADAGIDFILLDYTNNSGAKNSKDATEPTGSRKPYWENRFSYCWDWRPLFNAFSKAKEDGINVPKIGFMLSFTNQDKYEPSKHEGIKGTNEMLLCLYENLYEQNKYSDLWYRRDGKPFIMSYEPEVNESDKDFSSTDITKLKKIKSFFTFRNPGSTNVGSIIDENPHQNGWLWESLYPQKYGVSANQIEEVPVSPAQNASYEKDGEFKGSNMNDDASRGRNMPRNDNFLTFLSKAGKSSELKNSDFNGDYSFKYGGKEVEVNEKTPNGYFYGRNFQQQWDRAISLDPKVIFITGWNEWVVGKYNSNGKNVFVDEYNDQKSRDVEPSAGKLKDYYYYQMVENIRRFKGTNKLPSQLKSKTIDIKNNVNQWDDENIVDYNHYVTNDDYKYRSTYGWGSENSKPYENVPFYSNYTSIEGNDLKKAKVSYDELYIYFYLEVDTGFRDYGIDRTRLLIDTIDSENNASKNWEEYEYILNRHKDTNKDANNKLKLEKSTGGWNWDEVGDVEYTTTSNNGLSDNVLQVKIPRKYLGLKSENIRFNFKWIDNNIIDENGTKADIMNVYTDGDAAPGGRYAFAFIGKKAYLETSYTITYNLNGGSITGQKTSYTEETATFTLPTPIKTGYTFNGWTGTGLSGVTKTVTIPKGSTGNRTYTASWNKNTYTITYNLNEGSMTGQKTSYDVETESFTLPTPTKTGYTFEGWTGTGLTEKTKIVTIEKGSTGNRNYKANWIENVFEVSTYKIEESYIKKINPNTKCIDFQKNIITNQKYIIEEDGAQISQDDIIKTGQIIKVNDKEYILVVTGDVNRNGTVDIMDLLQLNKHRLSKINLVNESFIAGDVNEDGKIDIKDLLQINKYRLKKITSFL